MKDPTTNIRRLPVPAEADQLDWYPDDEAGPALPGQLSETGYTLPEGLSIGRWLGIGETLHRMERSVMWWLGDWWNYGERRYGEMASQTAKSKVEDATGHTFDTVRVAGYVAERFQFESRLSNVPWSYHQAVAPLDDDDAAALLREAVDNGWRRAQLREAVQERKTVISMEAARDTPAPAAGRLPSDLLVTVADARYLPLLDDLVDLTITSPPYGLDKPYDQADVAADDWPAFMGHWLTECLRVTKPSGRLALNVPLDTTKGGFRPTYAQAVNEAVAAGWTYRSTIVWIDDQLGKSTARGSQDSPAAPHVIAPAEMIALFSKGPWKQTSERPATLTHQEWLEWTCGYWRLPGETRPWEGHPAPYPFEIPRRLVRLLSFKGDTVLDPFAGSGTTILAATQLDRRAIGFDLSDHCVRSTLRRVVQ